MLPDTPRFDPTTRAIESVHSGVLLFGYTIMLTLFMAAVMFLNGH
ncbi:hypothetical protein [Halopiger goleimassiliensis]|nr:hypothetical protein [Halopiger goleimassiliensis]